MYRKNFVLKIDMRSRNTFIWIEQQKLLENYVFEENLLRKNYGKLIINSISKNFLR